MIYPAFIKPGDTIGMTAPSEGVLRKEESFDASVAALEREGFTIKETPDVRTDGLVSASGSVRADELKSLYADPEVTAVLCATGGDFLMEMLPEVDFPYLKEHPKWLQGYSDPTGLLYPMTTMYDVATLYGPNGGSYDMTELHPSLRQNLEILQGKQVIQESFEKYQSGWGDGVDSYDLDKEVRWETPNGSFDQTGRAIGGCLDVLLDLVGTRFDGTRDFLKRYEKDGFLWYFDVFGLRAEEVTRGLWQLKEAGWFAGARGFVFGRVRFPESLLDISYEEGIRRILPEEPLILNADIGHVKPQMTMINGGMCQIKAANGKGSIRFWEE